MKNLLNQKPGDKLRARQLESLKFVDREDVKRKTVLDIGCGYGWFEYNALKMDVKKIYGIEIIESDFINAVKSINSKKVEFSIGDGLKIPFKNKSFDTVVCWEVIEHLPKGKEAIMFSEVHRVLKDDGVFYLSTPYDNLIAKLLDPAWWLSGHRHYNFSLLNKFGIRKFKIVKVNKKGGIWSLGLLLNFYFSKWILRRQILLDGLFTKKEKREYRKKTGFMQIFVKYKKV